MKVYKVLIGVLNCVLDSRSGVQDFWAWFLGVLGFEVLGFWSLLFRASVFGD